MDIDGVQVANMTADEFHSKITDHSNGFVTLSLSLTQRLSETVAVNMTKFNTVPTNMSDDMGNIVTEIVTWGTSVVFGELKLAIENGCLESCRDICIRIDTFFSYKYCIIIQIYTSSTDPKQSASPSLHNNTIVGWYCLRLC